ncbi:MAG: hypothetical protein K5695_00605 [Oscillospiraceae bacterium]|nr:hypothetical protein [Oscillospiraceae bacterium]
MWKKLFPKLDKKQVQLYAIVIAGILGMVCILGSSFLPEKQEPAAAPEDASQAAYREELESQLTGMLGDMAGVGRVRVLVTLGGSEEYRYAQAGERTVSGDQVHSSTSYVTVGGSAKEPLLESVSHPAITGVVVACEGGGGDRVREAVYQAVSVACGLPLNKIYVTELG